MLLRSLVWHIAVLVASGFLSSGSVAQEEGRFKSLFDGKTLDGWDGDGRFWRVEDGAIVGQTTADVKT